MNDDLELDERLRACSHFAHRARHELLTPLSGLSMLCSMLSGRGPDLDLLAQQADSATKRMTALLRACTEFVDADLPVARPETVELESVLDEVERRLRAEEPRFSGAVVERHGRLPRVRGNALALRRVVHALLDNAARYATAPARIEVRAELDGDRCRTIVEDRGPGLTREQCEQVVQPFERLHAYDAIPGFGLSLATAQRVLRRHGGELGLAPRGGGGLVAWFALPRHPEDLRPGA